MHWPDESPTRSGKIGIELADKVNVPLESVVGDALLALLTQRSGSGDHEQSVRYDAAHVMIASIKTSMPFVRTRPIP